MILQQQYLARKRKGLLELSSPRSSRASLSSMSDPARRAIPSPRFLLGTCSMLISRCLLTLTGVFQLTWQVLVVPCPYVELWLHPCKG